MLRMNIVKFQVEMHITNQKIDFGGDATVPINIQGPS